MYPFRILLVDVEKRRLFFTLKRGVCVQKNDLEKFLIFDKILLIIIKVTNIYYLYQQERLTAKKLSELCSEDKAAISRTILFLEKNGYITCDTESKKRYKAQLFLTEKGKIVGEKIAQKIDGVLRPAGEGLSESDRESFYRALTLICNNLEAISKTYGEI